MRRTYVVILAVVLILGACSTSADEDAAVANDAPIPLGTDGGFGPEDAEPRWSPESEVGATACLLDLDCDPGAYCSLGRCVSDCSAGEACPSGLTCSPRGRCVVGAMPDEEARTSEVARGSLEVGPSAVLFGLSRSAATVHLRVEDLEAGQEFRYRVEASNTLVTVPDDEQILVNATSAGEVDLDIPITLRRDQIDCTRGLSTVRVITQAGTALVTISAMADPMGQWRGTLAIDTPLPFGVAQFGIEVWPSDAGAPFVRIAVLPENNLLTVAPRVFDGRFDPVTRRLTFGYADLVNHTYLGSTEVRGAPPGGLDMLSTRAASELSWTALPTNPADVSSLRHTGLSRSVGRDIQVSLTIDDDGVMNGAYVEVISGATEVPVEVRGRLRLTRSLSAQTLDELRSGGPLYTEMFGPSDFPEYPGPVAAPGVAASCGARVTACTSLTESSPPTALIDCGRAAYAQAFGLGADIDAAPGGTGYRRAYWHCTGLTDPDGPATPSLARPDLTAAGCADAEELTCAIAAFDAARRVLRTDDLSAAAFRGLLESARAAGEAYQFLANEYTTQTVRGPLREGTAASVLQDQVNASRYAAHAAYLANDVLFQPYLLDTLRVAPESLAGPAGAELRGAIIAGLDRSAGSVAAMLDATNDAILFDARANPPAPTPDSPYASSADMCDPTSLESLAAADDVGALQVRANLIRYTALRAYLQMAVLTQEVSERSYDDQVGIGQVAVAFGQLNRSFAASIQGLNPLGLDPSFIRMTGDTTALAGVSNFEVLAASFALSRPNSSLDRAQDAYTAFAAVDQDWNQAESELRDEVDAAIRGAEDELEAVCGVTETIPPNPSVDGSTGDPVAVTDPMLWRAYRDRVDAYIRACATSPSGEIAVMASRIDQAVTQQEIADERIRQLHALVQVENQRFQRVAGIRNRYLQYLLDDSRMLDAVELAEFDVRGREIERERSISRQRAIMSGVRSAGRGVFSFFGNGGVAEGLGGLFDAGAMTAIDLRLADLNADSAAQANSERRELARQRQEIQLRMTMRRAGEGEEVDLAESQALVESHLVRMAELHLEARLAELRVEEALLGLANALDRVQRSFDRRDEIIQRQVNDEDGLFRNPTYRLAIDERARQFRSDFAIAQRNTFELMRALEYEMGVPTGFEAAVFQATRPEDLDRIHGALDAAFECYRTSAGGLSMPVVDVSLRRDVFGLTVPWRDPVTNELVPTPEQFRARIIDPDSVSETLRVRIAFDTNLTVRGEHDFAVSSFSYCNDLVDTIEVQLVGDRLRRADATVVLSQTGAGLVRTCRSRAASDPAADEILSYSLAQYGNAASATIQAGVNAWSGVASPVLRSRPLAATQWVLEINLADPANQDLVLDDLDDVLIRFTRRARSVQAASAAFTLASCPDVPRL